MCQEKDVAFNQGYDLRDIIESSNDKRLNALAHFNSIQTIANKLYFVDGSLGTIETITLQGTSRREIFKDAGARLFSIDVFDDYLYYTDWNREKHIPSSVKQISDQTVWGIRGPAYQHPKVQCIHTLGDHETQVSEVGEVDLHKHYIDCENNPGHRLFIPVDRFTLNHLPEGHRDNDLYELIKVTADLTVRVLAKMTSPHRPEFWPGTKVSYPSYSMRGKIKIKKGSGMVCGIVEKFTDGVRDIDGGKHRKYYTTCWCKQCKHSYTASHVWWEFDVHTATHVVFDNIEASHTSCRLFFDRKGSPLVKVDQVSVVNVNIKRDVCELKCVTCDKNLADKLNKLWRNYCDVWSKVRDKYRKSRDVDKLNFIVSHPHGCSKQVSVGHWVDIQKVGDRFKQFTYTTCTCPGSSGAPVHCVGYTGDGVGVVGRWFYQLIHSGSIDSELNHSGAGHICQGNGFGLISLDEVNCTGTENHIVDCGVGPQNWAVHDCSHKDDAGVNCEPPEALNLQIWLNVTSLHVGHTSRAYTWGIKCMLILMFTVRHTFVGKL
ncbi:hypothetical protein Btru_050148 [Bulinus truncatus]|nr:hypothetical protein Btru_050148 [Bulinus truncatus]